MKERGEGPVRKIAATGRDLPDPQDALVAMIDVLGFKQIVAERKIEDLNRQYRDLLRLKRLVSFPFKWTFLK